MPGNYFSRGPDCDKEIQKRTFRVILAKCFHILAYIYTHVIVVFGCIYWFRIDSNHEHYLVRLSKHAVAAFLTNWNFVHKMFVNLCFLNEQEAFQTLFFSISFYHDILEWMDKHNSSFGKNLRYYRDITYSSLVFPFTLFVTAMFWGIYSVDRELVFPEILDTIVPWWFNHCVHTNITIMIIIEAILQPRRSPVNSRLELFLVCVVAVVYSIIYYSIFFFTHRWLYPVFGVLTWWQIILFQLMIFVSCISFYYIQYPFARLIHGPETEEEKEIKSQGIESGEEGERALDKRWSLNQRIEEDNSHL